MGVMRHTDRSLRSSSAATGFVYRAIYCLALALAFDLLLIYLPLREAEWRFCAVGLPAWMPGEPCWAKDGPSRRAHGAYLREGHLSAAMAVRRGKAFLLIFVVVRHSAV